MTATEVAERHEEKLLALGPVMERQQNEMHSPLIESAFSMIVEAGILPPAPEELQGRDLNVEFVSILAQAQRAISMNGIDRWVMNLGAVAQFKPEVLDKFDVDHWADATADMMGVDPEMVVPGETVVLIRQQREQIQQDAMQQQAGIERMAAGASAARDLASADTSGKNALTDFFQKDS